MSGFPTTAWTVVSRARSGVDSEAREALAFLCAAYWLPLYSFARRLGHASEDALDLTQGYFALLIEKDYLADVRLREGRFRTFLLTSFRHFLSKERDRARALKRGGGRVLLSIDAQEAEGRHADEPLETLDPEALFERRWALTILERAMTRLRHEFAATGRTVEFEQLEAYLTGSEPRRRTRAPPSVSARPRARSKRWSTGCAADTVFCCGRKSRPQWQIPKRSTPSCVTCWRRSGRGSRRHRNFSGRLRLGDLREKKPVMSAPVNCRDCGAPLMTSGALEGRCARCLLELAVEESQPVPSVPSDGITVAAPSDVSGLFHPSLILGGRYRLLRLLGRGGQGEVWHAFDIKLRVEVALKSLRPDLLRDDRARELLRREVRSARQVVSPNVCRVFDLVVEDGHEMVSMEFVDGTTLADLLRERGPLDLSRAGEIAAQLLAGLEAIHAAGLIHRDLKTENVMLTLSRRVVVMDFGIARNLREMQADTIAGTPGYMSPEQAAGFPLDARADVFSAAVVLAEMVSSPGGGTHDSRKQLWADLREDPPRVPAGPWSAVLRRALCRSPEGRYPSAGALARALELEQHATGRAEQSPYPGLLPFTREDARFFFGRELEVESLLRQLRRPRLRGVIGPSGAGKSSFLRAGVLPALPAGWSALTCTPTDRPFTALAQALAAEMVGDSEAVPLLPRFEDPGTAILLARRWRQRHEHALLVVDQAEELFTLNGIDVQRRFAELLGRFVLEADVHVLLSLRDDFLLQCQAFEDLRPIFSELMPLTPPLGAALRRALVQPALLSGYRFEDERLVDDMLRDVAQERGTLPLLAFAMARLWEHRDREHGLLTRRGYEEIGGVAGALAQHAEATLETIGAVRVPMVREILRNLVSAAGTRAFQERDELLSAFADQRGEAEEVLDRLVEARLLTSFEAPSEEGGTRHRRLEIIHESLLAAWPRLARWRDQDAEGARLRDQLRQAAQLWDERGRPIELLWSGPSFAEYLVWKARYTGRLSAREQSFGRAMEAQAGRRRVRALFGIGAAFAALLIVLAVVSHLWMRSRASEALAVQQAQRAEAQQLFALAQVEDLENPTLAFAYAIAALERTDTEEIRRFALRQLWKGPMSFVRSEDSNGVVSSLAFSADGEWLADAGPDARVWRRDGSGPLKVGSAFVGNVVAHFVGDGRRIAIFGRRNSGTIGADVLSLPELTRLEQIETTGEGLLAMRGNQLITVMPRASKGSGADIVIRSFAEGDARRLGFLRGGARRIQVDASGDSYFISYPGDRQLFASTLKEGAAGQRKVLSTGCSDFELLARQDR